jgi:hypothetical protein
MRDAKDLKRISASGKSGGAVDGFVDVSETAVLIGFSVS